MINIKSITIKNFKCFRDRTIIFSVPNWNSGSGLNIFVWPNNAWKSTVFEAINFLRSWLWKKNEMEMKNKYALENENMEVHLELSWKIREYLDSIKDWEKYKDYVIDISGEENLRLSRRSWNFSITQNWKTKELSIKNITLWNEKTSQYENITWADTFIGSIFDVFSIEANNDSNDDLKFSNTTTCWKLLSEIASSFSEKPSFQWFLQEFNKVFKNNDSELKKELDGVEEKIQNIYNEQFWSGTIDVKFSDPDVSDYFKWIKFQIDDLDIDKKGSWSQRAFALSLLQIYATLNTKEIWKPFYIMVDEPEQCLHPQAQKKLFNALQKITSNRQVFVTTHSPYFINPKLLVNVYKFILKDNYTEIYKLDGEIAGLFECQKLFDLENREIFFTDELIWVEWFQDRFRIRNFLNNQTMDFFVINGLQNFDIAKKVCEALSIKYKPIVDLDYIPRIDLSLLPDLDESEKDQVHEVTSLREYMKTCDEISGHHIEKQISDLQSKVNKCVSSKMVLKMQIDDEYKNKILAKIAEFNSLGIFVLSEWMIEHYLDRDWIPISEDKKTELSNFLI